MTSFQRVSTIHYYYSANNNVQFNTFILSCQPHSFLRFLQLLSHQYDSATGLVKSHLVDSMKNKKMAEKMLYLMEAVWDPTLLSPQLLWWCLIGIHENVDPILLESYCSFAISILDIEPRPTFIPEPFIRLIDPLLVQLRSIAAPNTFQRFKSQLSDCVARQEALRSSYYNPNGYIHDGGSRDGFLSNWIGDLGSPQRIAFAPSGRWSRWIKEMKGILAKYPDI